MAMSTRRLQRQNIREDEYDDFKDNPRSVFGGDHTTAANEPPQSIRQSYFTLDALTNPTSPLARFLFLGGGGGSGSNNNINADDGMPSMNDFKAIFYSMALEPMHIRNERIIMIFEAYTIFGALFFNAVWIIYEWGSYKGYGGDGSSRIVGRVFECIMAIALGSNMILTLFGAWFWISSINFNSSNQDYVFNTKEALCFVQMVYIFTMNFMIVGFVIGIYSNLSPYLPDTVVVICFSLILYIMGMIASSRHIQSTVPLEWYHMPRIVHIMFPWVSGGKATTEKLKADAKKRAIHLRQRAFCERKKLDPDFIEAVKHNNKDHDKNSIGELLRTAAVNLGRVDSDTSIYEARLEAEWLSMETLRGRSVEYLSKYMPTVLAEEVHRLIETKEG